jgi:hypothetical protein
MVPVTRRTQVTAEYHPDGAGRHLANPRRNQSRLVGNDLGLGQDRDDRSVPGNIRVPGNIQLERFAPPGHAP